MISAFSRGRLSAGLLLFWIWSLVPAANLSINPVRITLDNTRSIGALTLRNRGDEPVVMQAAVREWTIESNEEHYNDTDALIVTPPVFTVEPGREQIVRVGLRRPVASDTEQAFRVFLEQAPATPATPTRPIQPPTGIQVTLRFGIPVFIAPDGEPRREIEWRAERQNDGRLKIEAANRGNLHVQVKRLALLGTSGEPLVENDDLTYLLPGTTRHWLLEVPRTLTPPYRIKAGTRTGDLEAEITPGPL